MRDAGRDREDERACSPSDGAHASSAGPTSLRLHRDDHDVGVGDGPRRARHDPDRREARLEHPATVAVDLGDRERVGLAAGVEQPGEERLAHAAATEQRDAGHAARVPVAPCANATGAVDGASAAANASGPEERSDRFALPRTKRTSCTSGLTLPAPVGADRGTV